MKKEIKEKIEETRQENNMGEIMKQVFQPYDNFIDWALNRRTDDNYKERQSDRT